MNIFIAFYIACFSTLVLIVVIVMLRIIIRLLIQLPLTKCVFCCGLIIQFRSLYTSQYFLDDERYNTFFNSRDHKQLTSKGPNDMGSNAAQKVR